MPVHYSSHSEAYETARRFLEESGLSAEVWKIEVSGPPYGGPDITFSWYWRLTCGYVRLEVGNLLVHASISGPNDKAGFMTQVGISPREALYALYVEVKKCEELLKKSMPLSPSGPNLWDMLQRDD